MKKYLFLFGVLLLASNQVHGVIFDHLPERTVLVKYDFDVAADISTTTLAIDLSDTTNWPHSDTGFLNITNMRISVDKTAASTETIKVGVVNFVNASTGSVTWFHDIENESNVSNTNNTYQVNLAPVYYRLQVKSNGNAADGDTPFVFSNDTTAGSTTFQDDLVLPSTNGDTFPGAGDIVIEVSNGVVAITVVAEIFYHAEK